MQLAQVMTCARLSQGFETCFKILQLFSSCMRQSWGSCEVDLYEAIHVVWMVWASCMRQSQVKVVPSKLAFRCLVMFFCNLPGLEDTWPACFVMFSEKKKPRGFVSVFISFFILIGAKCNWVNEDDDNKTALHQSILGVSYYSTIQRWLPWVPDVPRSQRAEADTILVSSINALKNKHAAFAVAVTYDQPPTHTLLHQVQQK